jgi:hypothetical protein
MEETKILCTYHLAIAPKSERIKEKEKRLRLRTKKSRKIDELTVD